LIIKNSESLFALIPIQDLIFHPIISGFQSQLIWSGFFFVLSVICAVLSQKKSFEKWINFGLLPVLVILTGYGIIWTAASVASSNDKFSLAITLFTLLLILILVFKTRVFAILTFVLILIPISVNLLGTSLSSASINNQNLEVSIQNVQSKTIYKNVFLGIIWQKEGKN